MIPIVHCMYGFAFQFPQKKCYGKFISAFLRYHLPWFFLTKIGYLPWFFLTSHGYIFSADIIFHGSSSPKLVIFHGSSSPVVVVFSVQISSSMVLPHHLCLHYKYLMVLHVVAFAIQISSLFMVAFALQISSPMVLPHHLWLHLHYKYHLPWLFLIICGCICTTDIITHSSFSPFMVAFAPQISWFLSPLMDVLVQINPFTTAIM